jgi:hypothetical protein
MPTRFLSDAEIERLERFPETIDRRDLARHFELDSDDLRFVRQQNGEPGRLGIALQLCSLRWLGFVPDELSAAPPEAIAMVAESLDVAARAIFEYSVRAPTRREHRLAVREHARFVTAGEDELESLRGWLLERALEHERPSLLFSQACVELHRRRVERPAIDRVMRLVAWARERAHEQTFERLAPQLTDARRSALDALLAASAGERTRHAWLRSRPSSVSGRALRAELEKRQFLIEQVGADRFDLSGLPPNRRAWLAQTGGTPACRWLAVRHGHSAGGSDHVHVVVNLVREDGRAARVHMDRPRAQQACRELEQEFRLRVVEGRGRGAGERGVKPAEVAPSRSNGDRERDLLIPAEHTARRRLERIVRACATAAVDEADFVARLDGEGVLRRPRYERGGQGDVVGYSVALPAAGGGRPVWYGGGRLSRELTLPRMRAAWPELPAAARSGAWRRCGRPERALAALSPELEAQCARQLAQLRERLAGVRPEDRTTWALIARDAAGILAAWSLRTEPDPGPLAEAGRTLARSAQLRAVQVPGTPRRPFPPMQSTAQLLLRTTAGPASARILLSQVASLVDALRDMHAAAGEAARAAELEQSAARRLGPREGSTAASGARAQLGGALSKESERIQPRGPIRRRGLER